MPELADIPISTLLADKAAFKDEIENCEMALLRGHVVSAYAKQLQERSRMFRRAIDRIDAEIARRGEKENA